MVVFSPRVCARKVGGGFVLLSNSYPSPARWAFTQGRPNGLGLGSVSRVLCAFHCARCGWRVVPLDCRGDRGVISEGQWMQGCACRALAAMALVVLRVCFAIELCKGDTFRLGYTPSLIKLPYIHNQGNYMLLKTTDIIAGGVFLFVDVQFSHIYRYI